MIRPAALRGEGAGRCVVDNIDQWIEVLGGCVHVGKHPLPPDREGQIRLRKDCWTEARRLQRRSGKPFFHEQIADREFPYSDDARVRLLVAAGVIVQDDKVVIVAEPDATRVRELALDVLGIGDDPIVTPGAEALIEHLCGGEARGGGGITIRRQTCRGRPPPCSFGRPGESARSCSSAATSSPRRSTFWITHHQSATRAWRRGVSNAACRRTLALRPAAPGRRRINDRKIPSRRHGVCAALGIGPAEGTPEPLARERRKDFERILRTPIPAGRRGCAAGWHSTRQWGGQRPRSSADRATAACRGRATRELPRHALANGVP